MSVLCPIPSHPIPFSPDQSRPTPICPLLSCPSLPPKLSHPTHTGVIFTRIDSAHKARFHLTVSEVLLQPNAHHPIPLRRRYFNQALSIYDVAGGSAGVLAGTPNRPAVLSLQICHRRFAIASRPLPFYPNATGPYYVAGINYRAIDQLASTHPTVAITLLRMIGTNAAKEFTDWSGPRGATAPSVEVKGGHKKGERHFTFIACLHARHAHHAFDPFFGG